MSFGVGSSPDPNRYLVTATAADANGNLYVVGIFLGTVSFGSSTLTSISSQGGDVFVAKWSGLANAFVYAQRIGQYSATAAAGSAEISAPTVSGTNVYAAGRFSGTIWFGTGGNTLTSSSTQTNTYVARCPARWPPCGPAPCA